MGLFGRGRPAPDVRHVWGRDPIWATVAPLLADDVVELRGVSGPDVEPTRLRELFGAESIVVGERRGRFDDECDVTVATTPDTVRAAFAAEPNLDEWSWEQGLMRDAVAFDADGQRLWGLDSGTAVIAVYRNSSAAFDLLEPS